MAIPSPHPPDTPPCTASVVICVYTFEREAELRAAVRSVQTQSVPPEQIVVVVDHNEQLLARLVSELPGIAVIANSGPSGLSGARNAGAAVATGTIVAFLDDDAAADPTWLERLIAPYDDPAVAGVGGGIVPNWVLSRPAWFPDEFDWVVGCSYRGLPGSRAEVRNFIGANMSFRRRAIDEVGGFVTGIGRAGDRTTRWQLLEGARNPQQCEETEFCIRLREHDPRAILIYEPTAVVRHLVPPARGTWGYFVRRCYAEGTSKARIARLTSAAQGLSSERTYTTRVLPRGVARSVRAAASDRRAEPLGRAAAIVGGFGAVAFGFATGLLVGNSGPLERRSAGMQPPGGPSEQHGGKDAQRDEPGDADAVHAHDR